MQWDDTENAGFSTGTPWIDVNSNYRQINAASQVDDPTSIFSLYRELIELRHKLDVIVYGSYEPLMEDSLAIWAYKRTLDGQTITVGCNWTAEEVACDLWDGLDDERLVGNYDEHTPGVLKPYEAYATISRA